MEKLVSETYPLLQLLPLPRCVVLPHAPRLVSCLLAPARVPSPLGLKRCVVHAGRPVLALHCIASGRQALKSSAASCNLNVAAPHGFVLLRRATSRLSFSLILPLPACLSVHVLSALFKSSPACSLLLYPAAARWSRLPQHLRLPFFSSPCCRWRRRMEERAGEPSEVEEQGCAARPAKSRFGAVGPPSSS